MQRSDCSQGAGRGGRRQRTCHARRVEVAAVCRHSWFLTEEAQMEVQVLLPAAVCCYHSSQHCCSDSPGAAASQHSQTPTLHCTYTHFFFQLLWQAVQEEGFRWEHSPSARATRQADLLVKHTHSHAHSAGKDWASGELHKWNRKKEGKMFKQQVPSTVKESVCWNWILDVFYQ